MTEHFMTGLGQVIGVFLGVVAGVLISLAIDFVKARRAWKSELANLRFELDVNVAKVDAWLEDITQWRNAVNGDALADYFVYFKLSSVLIATTNSLFIAGKLYSVLTHDQITKLQEVFNDFSIAGEQYLNNQLDQKKQSLVKLVADGHADQWQGVLKPQCVRDINYWENKFRSHRNALIEVRDAVVSKTG